MAIFSSLEARKAVERALPETISFLQDLVRVSSLLGNEEPAQALVEQRLRDVGFDVRSLVPDEAELVENPDSGIPLLSYEGRRGTVGRLRPAVADARSS